MKLTDANVIDAYLEYLRKELHSVETESAKVSEEIERLSRSHAQGSILVFFYLFNVEEAWYLCPTIIFIT